MRDTGPAWSRGDRAKAAARLMLGWIALLWLLEIADTLSGHALDDFGIVPRVPGELIDIVPASFIHFGFAHPGPVVRIMRRVAGQATHICGVVVGCRRSASTPSSALQLHAS
ncbi:hypothetical protein P3T26_003058 [Streptomyces sp. MAA16]|nr:hypothetical protein [Streptomyces sp. MAA16]